MKKFFLHITLLAFFISLLCFPVLSLAGATNGLLLWYKILLPTLLPFIITTNLITKTNAFLLLSNVVGKPITYLFRTSVAGSFAVLIGFLCGYPMGAKVIGDLYKEKNIELNEAQYLLSFCNNSSPMFISSVLISQILKDNGLLTITFVSLFMSPLICSFFSRKFYRIRKSSRKHLNIKSKKFQINMIDESIMEGIYLIVKIGGYVMVFSILITLLFPLSQTLFPGLKDVLPLLELTNGITMYEKITAPFSQYLHLIFITAFGGCCAIFQTNCVLEGTKLKISHYIVAKIITGIIATVIAYFLYYFFI